MIYVLRDGQMVNKDTGEPMLSPEEKARPIAPPRVFGDMEGYESPVTGEWIEGRKAMREDLAKHGCINHQDLKPYGWKPTIKGGERARRFAEKHGVLNHYEG